MTRRAKLFWGGVGLLVAFVAWRGAVTVRYRTEGGRLLATADGFRRRYEIAGARMSLVALGDSTAQGVGADRLEETLPNLVASKLGGGSVENRAVAGARLADVVQSQLLHLPTRIDVALVSISANDATHGTEPKLFEADLRRLLDGLKATRRVAVTTTPNFRTTPALPLLLNRLFERRAATLSETVRRVAKGYPNVRVVDLNVDGTLDEEQYAADGFHPSAEGYRLWASIFKRALEG